MRIMVFSDSHGRGSRIETAIYEHPEAKHIFFLGDKLSDIEDIKDCYPDRTFYTVPGNCDFAYSVPQTKSVCLGGKKIIYTHGHEFSVKSGVERLESYSRSAGAQLVLYGHTHVADSRYSDGLYLVNPGSIGKGGSESYAIVDLEPSGIMANIIKI